MAEKRLLCRCACLPLQHILSRRIQVLSTCRQIVQISSSQYEPKSKKTSITAGQMSCLRGVLGCTYLQAYAILKKHKTLLGIEGDRIHGAILSCGKFAIEKEDILKHPDVMSILPATIEHHSMLLLEGGFSRIQAHTLVNYLPAVSKNISLLKAYSYIPSETNVVDSLMRQLWSDEQPVELPYTLEESQTSFITTTVVVLKHYLAWRLCAEPQQIEAIFKTYQRLRHKSFKLMRRSLDLLENELGFSKEKILKNGFLIHSSPDNVEQMLRNYKVVGGMPFLDLVATYPKILMTAVDTIQKTMDHLKHFKISKEAIQKCPDIFTLGSDTVYRRLSNLQVVPEFQVLLQHPRILRLVYYQRKAKTRLDYLKELRVKCASLHVLAATEGLFEKYARDGADKTRGSDVVQYLSQKLDHNDQDIRSMLMRHPYWCHVPLLAVQETLTFLRSKEFTKEQVVSAIHIILYPKLRVERELASLASHPELAPHLLNPMREGWTYAARRLASSRPPSSSDSSSDSDGESSGPESSSSRSFFPTSDPSTGVLGSERFAVDGRDLRLNLCVYFIEKEHHFTGNGIWTHPHSSDGLHTDALPTSALA